MYSGQALNAGSPVWVSPIRSFIENFELQNPGGAFRQAMIA